MSQEEAGPLGLRQMGGVASQPHWCGPDSQAQTIQDMLAPPPFPFPASQNSQEAAGGSQPELPEPLQAAPDQQQQQPQMPNPLPILDLHTHGPSPALAAAAAAAGFPPPSTNHHPQPQHGTWDGPLPGVPSLALSALPHHSARAPPAPSPFPHSSPPPSGMLHMDSSSLWPPPPSGGVYHSSKGNKGNRCEASADTQHPSIKKVEHLGSKATRRGPMDEMRQLVRILVKFIPKSADVLKASLDIGGGNRVSEDQIKTYLRGTLGEEAPQPEWGLPEGWGQYLSELLCWALERPITREQAMSCARRQQGRSWEIVEAAVRDLDIYSYAWPVPLTLEGIRKAQAEPGMPSPGSGFLAPTHTKRNRLAANFWREEGRSQRGASCSAPAQRPPPPTLEGNNEASALDPEVEEAEQAMAAEPDMVNDGGTVRDGGVGRGASASAASGPRSGRRRPATGQDGRANNGGPRKAARREHRPAADQSPDDLARYTAQDCLAEALKFVQAGSTKMQNPGPKDSPESFHSLWSLLTSIMASRPHPMLQGMGGMGGMPMGGISMAPAAMGIGSLGMPGLEGMAASPLGMAGMPSSLGPLTGDPSALSLGSGMPLGAMPGSMAMAGIANPYSMHLGPSGGALGSMGMTAVGGGMAGMPAMGATSIQGVPGIASQTGTVNTGTEGGILGGIGSRNRGQGEGNSSQGVSHARGGAFEPFQPTESARGGGYTQSQQVGSGPGGAFQPLRPRAHIVGGVASSGGNGSGAQAVPSQSHQQQPQGSCPAPTGDGPSDAQTNQGEDQQGLGGVSALERGGSTTEDEEGAPAQQAPAKDGAPPPRGREQTDQTMAEANSQEDTQGVRKQQAGVAADLKDGNDTRGPYKDQLSVLALAASEQRRQDMCS